MAMKVRDALTRDYSDEEQRDANGRWTAGGTDHNTIITVAKNSGLGPILCA